MACMSVVNRLPVVRHQEDVFAADETKVHTLSRARIGEMLDQAAIIEKKMASSVPPPPSGVRMRDAVALASVAPQNHGLPTVWNDDDEDEEGLEPTRLSERFVLPTLPAPFPPSSAAAMQVLVAPAGEPVELPPMLVVPSSVAPLSSSWSSERPSEREVNQRALVLGIVAFVATLVPALWMLLR